MSDIIEIEFVGGPLDGERRMVHVYERDYLVARPRSPLIGVADAPLPSEDDPIIVDEGVYRRHAFRSDGHGSTVMRWMGWKSDR